MRVILIFFCFLSFSLWSHEDSHESGFELSSKAIESLGIDFRGLKKQEEISIPAAALVQSKDRFGVYIKRSDKISLVFVKVLSQSNEAAVVSSDELKDSDEIAVKGADFLRMIEESGGITGHSH